ncbi:MAG: FHA domain-containing protein [Blastochloris sp.]|nr:FHA domain-containing protein [Blastochloris sp.]
MEAALHLDETLIKKNSFATLHQPSNLIVSTKSTASFAPEQADTLLVEKPGISPSPENSKAFASRKTMNVDTQTRVPHIMLPFTIGKSETKLIGRAEDCDIVADAGDVSRNHCQVIFDGKTLKVKDLGSSNGTFLNGKQVTETIVSSHDILRLGSVPFIVVIDG